MAKFQIAWDWTFRELPEQELRNRCRVANHLGRAGCRRCQLTSSCKLDAYNEGTALLYFIVRLEPTCNTLWCTMLSVISDDDGEIPPCDGHTRTQDPGFLP